MQRKLKLSLQEICNCQWFNDTSVILFLNKSDLFKEKIKQLDMKCCFDDYTGGCNFDNGVEFLKKKFTSLNRNLNKIIYVHVTCATDTENIKFVFQVIIGFCCRQSVSFKLLSYCFRRSATMWFGNH